MKVILKNSVLRFDSYDYTPNEFTAAAIKASGNNTMSAKQKIALEAFFTSIGAEQENSIYSKMMFLFIPFIANDLTHTLVNYKGNDVSIAPDSDTYAISDSMGIYSEGMPGNTPVTLLDSFSPNMLDGSYFLAFTEAIKSDEHAISAFSLATNSDQYKKIGFSINTNRQLTIWDTNSRSLDLDYFPLGSKNIIGISLEGTTVHQYNGNDKTSNFVSPVRNAPFKLMCGYTGTLSRNKTPLGFAAYGTGLTKEETQTFGKAIEDLRLAFVGEL